MTPISCTKSRVLLPVNRDDCDKTLTFAIGKSKWLLRNFLHLSPDCDFGPTAAIRSKITKSCNHHELSLAKVAESCNYFDFSLAKLAKVSYFYLQSWFSTKSSKLRFQHGIFVQSSRFTGYKNGLLLAIKNMKFIYKSNHSSYFSKICKTWT